MWQQQYDPLAELTLSAVVAALPLLLLFYLLAIRRAAGQVAAAAAMATAIAVAVYVYHMPGDLALASAGLGMLYGLWPVFWVVFTTTMLYNVMVETEKLEIIKYSITQHVQDRRGQVLLVAFGFGSLLESVVGFGAATAICTGLLVGLGFRPVLAAGLCLIANTVSIVFGSLGLPVIVAGQMTTALYPGVATEYVTMGVSHMVGRLSPLVALLMPFYLVVVLAGRKGLPGMMIPCLAAGSSFGVCQWLGASYFGPGLAGILPAMAVLTVLTLLLKAWRPKTIWRFPDEDNQGTKSGAGLYDIRSLVTAWLPFLLLLLLLLLWEWNFRKLGLGDVKSLMESYSLRFTVDALHNKVLQVAPVVAKPKAMAAVFQFNWLSAAGTAVFVAMLISAFIFEVGLMQLQRSFIHTYRQLWRPLITVACVMGLAFVMQYSGMSATLGLLAAGAGKTVPIMAALIGWLGVFLTGSDASTNALLGNLHGVAAQQNGVEPILAVAANAAGGAAGRMVSPQALAIAAEAAGMGGREGEIFNFTVRHSVFFAAMLAGLTYLQANWLPWLVPVVGK